MVALVIVGIVVIVGVAVVLVVVGGAVVVVVVVVVVGGVVVVVLVRMVGRVVEDESCSCPEDSQFTIIFCAPDPSFILAATQHHNLT